MAVSFNDVQTICQEAFYILRQDATVLSETSWSSETPIEVAKCKLAIETAVNEVVDAFDWGTSATVSNISAWPRKVRNACVYCLARELAIPIAGRIEDMKAFDALYRDKLLQAKLEMLNTELKTNSDPVLAELIGNFRTDDTGLVNAYSIYTKRSTTIKAESTKEVKATLGVTTLDDLAQQIADCLSVAKLSAACGLDANVKQLKTQEYASKIQEWRKVKLNKELESNTDPVLAELLSNFRGDDAGLINAYAVYTKRSTTIKAESTKEVKATLGVTTLDDLAQQIADCLSVAKLSTACGLDANVKQLKTQEYATKVQEWRKVKLNEKLATNTDPVLTQLIANFRADDAGLINAYDIYTKRSTVAKDTSAIEINAAHDWTTKFASTDTKHPAYPAWLVLACAKLASACGFAADRVQLYMAEYDKLLSTARAADLEAAKRAITDADTKEVLSMISTNFVSGDAAMPRSITAITDRIDALKSSARKEVILSQDWNFAKVVDVQDCCEQQMCHVHDEEVPYVYEVQYPVRALRLIAVYGHAGELDEWKVEDGFIKSRQTITKIKYTADVTDFTRWSEFAKRAYIHRLAADVARTVMNNPTDADRQERLYSLALENAKLRDTRESSTPTDAWGGNHHVMAMQGGFRPHFEEWR